MNNVSKIIFVNPTAIEIINPIFGFSATTKKLCKQFCNKNGINDMEMLQYVNYGIAMGNANEALKEIACDITGTHDEDGIYNSFKKYRLI